MEISWSARPLPRDYSHDDDNEKMKKEWISHKKSAPTARAALKKEIVSVWTRLNLKYKTFVYCEKILNYYILYKENIENYLIMIEIGARFRNKCVMHGLPFEVRKKIYDEVVKACCDGNLMECEAFAKRLFP